MLESIGFAPGLRQESSVEIEHLIAAEYQPGLPCGDLSGLGLRQRVSDIHWCGPFAFERSTDRLFIDPGGHRGHREPCIAEKRRTDLGGGGKDELGLHVDIFVDESRDGDGVGL